MKKTISIICCILLVISIFSGCGAKEKKIDLIYPFSGKINSYDPQVAAESDEFLIIENCFEGLVRSDDEGNITPGCAASWRIENDGLKYTFNLQKGLKWYIFKSVQERMGEDYNPEITADDFVFALQRAVSRETESPLYSTISCIENAPAVYEGSAAADSLGVRAVDKYTLEITLSSADNGFIQALSTAVAMPCNRDFFEKTNGRYGLDLMYTMFNGQFIVTNELDKSYILKNNKNYNGPSPAKATDLTLKIVEENELLAEKLLSGYYDSAYLRGYESVSINEKDKIKLVPYSNITWAMIINTDSGILANQDARHAIALSLSEPDYEKYDFLTKAKGFIPPSCTANGKSFTEQSKDVTLGYSGEQAVELWKEAAKDDKIYSSELTFIVPDTMEEAAKQILQGVQSSLGAISNVNGKKISISIKLEAIPENELKTRTAARDYDIALYPFKASSASPVSFLQTFSDNNITGFYDEDFINSLETAKGADTENFIEECEKCERALIDTYCYTPLFYESNFYASAKGVSGVQFHAGTGRVSFVYADRED